MAGDDGRVAGHEWVAAAEVRMPATVAARAASARKVKLLADVVVQVVDVYCERCRRSWSAERATEKVCLLGSVHVGGPRHRDDESIPVPRAAKPPRMTAAAPVRRTG